MNRPPQAPPAVPGRMRPPPMPPRSAVPRPLPEPVLGSRPEPHGVDQDREQQEPPPARDDRHRVRQAARARRRALEEELRRPGTPRTRARLLVAGVGAALVLLVVLPLLLAFAPVFTVAAVEVPGASPAVAEAVRTALRDQLGRPIATVRDADVAAAVRRVPAVASFAVVRRPPSVLEVRVVQRTPVAQQRSGTDWQQVDAARVVIASSGSQWDDLPVVSVGSDRPARSFAAVMAAVAAVGAAGLQVGDVRADGPDDVVLTLPGGRRVQWGGAEDGAEKAQALKAALVKAARGVEQIDVSSPGVVLTR